MDMTSTILEYSIQTRTQTYDKRAREFINTVNQYLADFYQNKGYLVEQLSTLDNLYKYLFEHKFFLKKHKKFRDTTRYKLDEILREFEGYGDRYTECSIIARKYRMLYHEHFGYPLFDMMEHDYDFDSNSS